MAVIEMKRKRAKRKSLFKREAATVKLGIHFSSWLSCAGQRRAVNGRRLRWITSGKGVAVIEGERDHLSLMLTKLHNRRGFASCSKRHLPADLRLRCNTMCLI